MSTPGTRRSTSNPATSSICRRSSGSTSGSLGREDGMKLRHVLLTAGIALAVGSPALSAPANKPVFGDWGYDASAMDNSVKPGDDFFAYVNGSWDKRTQIDPQRTFAGIDSVLNDQIDR